MRKRRRDQEIIRAITSFLMALAVVAIFLAMFIAFC